MVSINQSLPRFLRKQPACIPGVFNEECEVTGNDFFDNREEFQVCLHVAARDLSHEVLIIAATVDIM